MVYKKIIVGVVFLAVTGLLFSTGIAAVQAYGSDTISGCLALGTYAGQINCLTSLLNQLQGQLAQLQNQQGQPQGWCYAFNTNLGIGAQGPDFGGLVNALYKENLYNPNAHVTSFYDETIASAVVQFQSRYGILPTGYVGPVTRAKLNSLYNCNNTVPPTPLIAQIYGFTANGSAGPVITVPSGSQVQLAWTSINAQYCLVTSSPDDSTISRGAQSSQSGTMIVRPVVNTYYTVTCYNSIGNGTAYITVNVNSGSTYSGACQIRDAYTSVPSSSAPDTGMGYAKLTKFGINTLDGLRNSCTQSDYSLLMSRYCAANTRPVQQEVVMYDANGNLSSLGSGNFGSNFISCSGPVDSSAFVVTAPTGGEVWALGSSHVISWSFNRVSNFAIDLVGNDNAHYRITSFPNVPPGNGSYTWTVGTTYSNSPPPAGQYRLSFYDPNNPSSPSYSNYFSIVGTSTQTQSSSINLTAPNGGEVWRVGEARNITWQTSNIYNPNDKITIYIVPAGALDANYSLAQQIANTGSFSWTVDDPVRFSGRSPLFRVGNQFKIFICSQSISDLTNLCSGAVDYSDNSFTIVAATQITPTISMTANGQTGSSITSRSGAYVDLRWTATNASICNVYITPSDISNGDHVYNQSFSGAILVWPTQNTTYTVTCYNTNGGQASNSMTVNVTGPTPLTASSADLIGAQSSYGTGQQLRFSVRAYASDGSLATRDKGFSVVYGVRNGQNLVQINGTYQFGTAAYNSSTGNWDIATTAPFDTSKSYTAEAILSCEFSTKGCYSTIQVEKKFSFTVFTP